MSESKFEDRLTENGVRILKMKYLRTLPDGTKETGNQFVKRIAHSIANGDSELEKVFHDMIMNKKMIANTPCLINAGMPYEQLSACFVLNIADNLGTEGDGIFNTLKNAALIQQTGGGVGYNFGKMRSKGSIVSSSGGQSSGPVSFLKVYNSAFDAISQGGCLVPETLVFTDDGLLELDEIVDVDVEGWQSHSVTVPTDEGFRHSPRGFNNNVAPIFCIETEDGLEIAGTYNHKIKVKTPQGPQWKELAEIALDDEVLCMAGVHRGKTQLLKNPPMGVSQNLDEKMAFFLGSIALLFDNEWKSKFATDWLKNNIEKVFENTFPNLPIQKRETPHGWQFILDNPQILSFLRDNIIWPASEHIPPVIRKSPPSVLLAYINGIISMYQDGTRMVAETLTFAREIVTALQGLGIKSRILPVRKYIVKTEDTRELNVDKPYLIYKKVIGISKRGNRLTLDIEVDGNHTYIANGFVTHNTRRGANMACMPVSHPDIEEFIDCKKGTETANTNFNLSVMLDNVFMKTLLGENPNKNPEDKKYDYPLIHPNTGKVAKIVDARDLYDHICQNAWSNGEPGVLFPDIANLDNMIPHVAQLEATNPCGEIWLTPFESCCLAHLNLPAHFVEDTNKFDLDLLETSIKNTVTFLDNMLTVNKFVPAVPELAEAAKNYRRIGLGLTGFHDFLIRLGKAYDESSIPLIKDLMKFIYYTALKQSVELAKKYGAFRSIKGSLWDPLNDNFGGRILNKHLIDPNGNTIPSLSNTKILDWESLLDDIVEYGVRNSHLLAIAPTGTTSSLIGVEGYGCEPIFSPSYTRTLATGGTLKYVSQLYMKTLEQQEDWAFGYIPKAYQEKVFEYIAENGKLPPTDDPRFENAPISETVRKVLSCSAPEVSPQTHILIQAAFQESVDNSISKTVNLPNSATIEDIKGIYKTAWMNGLKGVTVYRASSRQFEPLKAPTVTTTASTDVTSSSVPSVTTTEIKLHLDTPLLSPKKIEEEIVKRPRPVLLKGCTIKKPTGFGDVFVTINTDDNNDPFEVFVTFGKSGEDLQANTEALGRLISLNLRQVGGPSPREKLKQIIDQLSHIGGRFSVRDKESHSQLRSIPDSIASALKHFLGDCETSVDDTQVQPPTLSDPPKKYDLCPECHQATLIHSEHCLRCTNCSYSRC